LQRAGHVLGVDRPTGSGGKAGLKCHADARAAAWRRVGRVRSRPWPPTTCGRTDFVFDTCANGQTLKCLTIIDEFTRECLAIDVAGASAPAG